jgi:hypothetical protein
MLRNPFRQAIVPPLRERLGDPNRLAIPLTYPGKRKHHIPRSRTEGRRIEDLHGQLHLECCIGSWLIRLNNQSPRVPARFPKATTIRRKKGEERKQIESRKEQSNGGRGVPAHNRKSAIFLRPRKANIIVCCIYHAPQSHAKRSKTTACFALSADKSDGTGYCMHRPNLSLSFCPPRGAVAAMFQRAETGEFLWRGILNIRLVGTPQSPNSTAYSTPARKSRENLGNITCPASHHPPNQIPFPLNSFCVHSHSSSASLSSAASFVNAPLTPTGS